MAELEGPEAMSDTRETNEDQTWLDLAREAFRESTSHMESSLRKQRETNYAMFRSKHPPGSKYYTDAYKFRSKLFRPKIRGAIRRHEAAAAVAFFATQDVVSVSAENNADELARAGAQLQQELLNYRLEHSIKWFPTVIGAYQESMVIGSVCSKQYWDYAEKTQKGIEPVIDEDTGEQAVDEDTGELMFETSETVKVLRDKSAVRLLPPENVRYSPAADWLDPVESSPYFIEMIPMYIDDIKTRMTEEDPKTGQPRWRTLTDAQITSASGMEYDSTRQAREGTKRLDSKENNSAVNEFNVRWVHENHIRIDGEDMVFYTLGTEFMLSDPVPLEDVYLHNKRPYVIGVSQIEAHRLEPTSVAELGYSTNVEANDIANQRLDNVKLAMNKRYFVRRGAQVDFRALTRSVPGGVTLVDDIQGDVKVHETTDVTQSSYHEQDRLSLDFDEVVGSFSPGSVQSNRKLNETVGGMQLLSDDSNTMSEYQLRVFSETWVEPVLRQLAALERAYESDEAVLLVAGDRAKIWDKVSEITEDMISAEHTVRVSVGFGATSPQKRIEKLAIGLDTVARYAPQKFQQANADEIIKEVFGALGYKGADRFFTSAEGEEGPTPEMQQAQQQLQEMSQQIQELTMQIQSKTVETQGKVQIADMNIQAKERGEQMKNETTLQAEKIRQETDIQLAGMKSQLGYIDSQIKAEGNAIKRGELELQKQALLFQMKSKEVELLKADSDSMSSVLMRDQYGMAPKAEG